MRALVMTAATAAFPLVAGCVSARPAEPIVVQAGEARIAVRTIGNGPPVLLIPSLGRGVEDFGDLASAIARSGRTAVLAEPRGIGASTGPAPKTLADLADDAAAAIAAISSEPADVVGHAFGQRVARQLAARHPERVRSLVLLAAGGRVDMPLDVRQSLATAAAEGEAPDGERLRALQHVFFAPGNDASVWLKGWHPAAARAQSAAAQATPLGDWWGGGNVDILVVQPLADPIAPPANSAALVSAYGDRVRVVNLPHASHAVLPEQPAAVSAVVNAFLDGSRDAASLQAAVDRHVIEPDLKH